MIKIIQTDEACEIFPWISELGKTLQCKKKVMKLPSEYRKEVQQAIEKHRSPGSISRYSTETTDLFTVDGNNHAFFMPGLIGRVERTLKKLRLEYEVEKRLDPSLRPPPDWSLVGDLRGRQLEILATVALADGGVVKAATGYGKSHLIRKLCLMYPGLNILVISKAQSVVKELYTALHDTLPEEVGAVFAGINNAPGKRIVVTTTKSLHKINAEEVQLLILDECHACGMNDCAEQLSRFLHCRRFGLTATPYRTDGTAIMMETFFGPTLIDIEYQESVDTGNVTQIGYTMVDVPKGPTFIEDDVNEGRVTSNLFKKRWAYWRNFDRNRLIADIAESAVSRGLQTLIMVETLEHAIKLHQYLPDAPVVHYGKTSEKDFEELAEALMKDRELKALFIQHCQEHGIPEEDVILGARRWLAEHYSLSQKQKDSIKQKMADGDLRLAIATLTWGEGINLSQLNVLIRAEGITSRIRNDQIPGRLSRLWEGKKMGLLVDFSDGWTPWASNNARLRELGYSHNRWQRFETVEELFSNAHQ